MIRIIGKLFGAAATECVIYFYLFIKLKPILFSCDKLGGNRR